MLLIGFLASLAGLGFMYFSAEEEERNQGNWFFNEDPDRTEENQQRYEAGRLLMIGGLIVLTVGALLFIVGGTGRTTR
jgi:hypothetical protein